MNEAWRAAGFDGTISPTLVNKTRVKLTGKRRRKARTAAQGKAAATKPREAPATLGKTSFVKEFLNDNPQGNCQSRQRGVDGSRDERDDQLHPHQQDESRILGLTGNLRGKSKTGASAKATTTGKRRGRPPKETTAAVNGQACRATTRQEERPDPWLSWVWKQRSTG